MEDRRTGGPGDCSVHRSTSLPVPPSPLHFPRMTRSTSHRWAIDAIEEGMARVEEDGERMISVPVYLLPAGVREGQVLQVSSAPGADRGTLVVTVAADDEATADSLAKSKTTTARAMAQSRKRDRGGDVAL